VKTFISAHRTENCTTSELVLKTDISSRRFERTSRNSEKWLFLGAKRGFPAAAIGRLAAQENVGHLAGLQRPQMGFTGTLWAWVMTKGL
jgi:hypothetical protein